MQPLIDSDEVWEDVVGYEGLYEVSSHGRVWATVRIGFTDSKRTGGHFRKQGGQFIKGFINKLGYVQLPLRKDGKTKLHTVHRLVAMAFLPNQDKEVNHIDGVKSNNLLGNLEWSNRRQNALHSTRVLGKNRGESNSQTKLTKEQVLEIKELLETGSTQTELGALFDITNHAIYRIQHGFNWSWVTGYDRKGGERCL